LSSPCLALCLMPFLELGCLGRFAGTVVVGPEPDQ